MGLSGLALVGFMVTHMAGNLLLYIPGGEAFNGYVLGLHSWGWLLIAAELGLAFLFIFHIVLAIQLKLENKSARPVGYDKIQTKGGPSRWSFASVNMMITGTILAVFLVLHVKKFRFGPGIEQGYVTTIKGQETRDLYRLVHETFQDPLYVGLYVAVMIFFGFHIRHGFWSAFQSLGLMRPRYSGFINAMAIIIALIFVVGFIGMPIFLYCQKLGVTS